MNLHDPIFGSLELRMALSPRYLPLIIEPLSKKIDVVEIGEVIDVGEVFDVGEVVVHDHDMSSRHSWALGKAIVFEQIACPT